MNFKPVIFTCIITFVLSFFVALISGAGFGISLLRGLILAVCFGALSVGISFLFSKFLNDGSYSQAPADIQHETNLPPIGNKVDITISDEELQEDDFSPKFVLTGQNQMLNEEDLGNEVKKQTEEKPVQSEQSQEVLQTPKINSLEENIDSISEENTAPSFKPVPLAASKPETQSKPEPAAKPVAEVKPEPQAQSGNFSSEFPDIEDTLGKNSILSNGSITESDVDVLPDMGGTVAGLKDDTVTDSEFASAGKSSSRLSDTVFPDGSMADSKDSTLMAEAIRTILRKEE